MNSLNIISEILKPKTRLSRLLMLTLTLLVALLGMITLIFSEIKKQDISKSQLDIEKNRISQIDKQLSNFYSKTYTQNDSISISKGYNKEYLLKQIDFLKKQREEAVKNIDNNSQNPDAQILIFTLLAGTLTIFVLTFFTSSFKSNIPLSTKERINKFTSEQRKKFIRNNEAFLSWATTNEIAQNNTSGIDLEKAKSLKEIYDMSEKLGEDRNDFLNLIINFTNLKRKQDEIQNDKHSQIYSVFDNIQERLKDECNRLNKQAIINLFLCFFIAFILMSYITYTSIFVGDIKYSSTLQYFIVKYIPKIIAVTSFLTMFLYFVKLYKTNIIDVKYYQNELTNVEIKQASLKTALLSDDKEIINKVTLELLNIERNAIITKEQTSLEIERIKLENEINKDYLNKTWELLSLSKIREEKNG